ncbi:S-adenosyl-L-methionine-dependent methyltransferase [Basidiobolus meristosporus CBS 931.73]|uniref:S-adenosyl-L-methionine-dependent methyltransferase n=1 Tax=Basidiobolus meristosporus CBS 931.73 TaxID=1314790 RepID=A0A1Y1YPJ8_9FUNG|nr:S-adenosyl-L-methionine-dependent methyltransferase [Basidiobolus meristosporus CBS 931.73]|eukprot:ORX99931.1 S-adenosyl-L-methionine-dependent methyltransferase [Basidiobolus meristosporus CBS 931.73]
MFARYLTPNLKRNLLNSIQRAAYSTEYSVATVFDRKVKQIQRDRAALNVTKSREVDYLKDEIAARVVDRLLDIKKRFHTVVDVGSGCGHVVKHLDEDIVSKVIQCELSENMLHRDAAIKYDGKSLVEVERKVVDEEALPFEEDSLEAVVSSLSLHWVNDLPGALIQIRRALKPDGVFIGAMFGGDTIYELRTSLQLAELEREGGISPHVSPMADSRDLGSLLSRAGFNLTTVDVDEIVVNYPSPAELMSDLQAMGESNAVINSRGYLHRDTLLASHAIYKELYGNPDGTIPATFQILYMIGWKPDPTQPKPKPRGSATTSLKDVLEDKANPSPDLQ